MTSSEPRTAQQSMGGARAVDASQPHAKEDVTRDLLGFLDQLLELQCSLVGASGGIVFLSDTASRQAGVSVTKAWPGGGTLHPEVIGRLEVAGKDAQSTAARSGLAGTLTLPSTGSMYGEEPDHPIAVIGLFAAGNREGSCVLVLPRDTSTSDALERLELTADKFEAHLWQQRALGEARQKILLRETIELIDTAQQGTTATAMASLLAHDIARRFACARVSVGLVTGERIRVTAVSGADLPDPKAQVVESLEAAMEEVAAQDVEVVFPSPPENEANPIERRVTRAAEELSKKHGPSCILGLPLRVEGDLVGAIILEREPDDPFPAGSVALLRLVAEYTGPALWTRRLADRGVLRVAYDRIFDMGEWIVGPRHTAAKLVGLLFIVVMILLSVVPIPARVSAHAEVRPATSRTIVPPFAGYLAEVLVHPGDVVEVGETLARMDTSEIDLSMAERIGRRGMLSAERDESRARREMAKARQLDAQIREIQAEIDLFQSQIDRATITASISGIVGRGDLEDFVDARVEPSQPLFELVTNKHIVLIEIDERSVGDVEVGDTGRFATKALPGRKAVFTIDRINPIAHAVEGANVYLAEASLDPEVDTGWLRPGMTGTARINNGKTTGMAALGSPLVDRLRLWLWW